MLLRREYFVRFCGVLGMSVVVDAYDKLPVAQSIRR